MAACRQSKGFSSDGSITDCRLLPVLRFPLSRCTSSPGSRATAVRCLSFRQRTVPDTFNDREIKKAT